MMERGDVTEPCKNISCRFKVIVSNFHFGVLVYCFKEVYFLVGLEVRQCFFKYWLIDLALKLIKRCFK